MVLFQRLLLAGLLGGGSTAWVGAKDVRLPPITGEIHGKLTLPKITAMPPLDWRLILPAPTQGRRLAEFSVVAVGVRLLATADVDSVSGDGTWTLREGEVDPESWFSIIAPELAAEAQGISASGKVVVKGGGTLKTGRPAGEVSFIWPDGTLRNVGEGWSLEQIRMTGECSIDATGSSFLSNGPFELTIGTVTTKRLGARKVFVSALLNVDNTITLKVARLEIAGGEMTIDPCTIVLFPLTLDLNLRITRIGLQDVAALVPAGLSDARGRVDGEFRVMWTSAEGLKIGAGNLGLRADESATVRLAPSPGFLTRRVPQRITLLPAWTGALSRWLAPVNPAYEDLRTIEMGETDLRVESMSVRLTPEKDERGRTATVKLSARPEQAGGRIKEVTFEVNVSGPLSDVIRMGFNQTFSIQAR